MHRSARMMRFLALACCAWGASGLGTSWGVVVSSPYDAPTLVAPASDPGWANVARLSNASSVYLGNGWMITANHVGQTSVKFDDGRVFNVVPGSQTTLSDPTGFATGSPDLRMFRLLDDPGLPSITVASNRPANGANVIMIGYGVNRDKTPLGWEVSGTTLASSVWKPVTLPHASAIGFNLLTSSQKRWGANQISANDTFANNTLVFPTVFHDYGSILSGQATVGDSGGGVFSQVGGQWQLVGIMDSVLPIANQPSNTVVYGQSTYSVDIAYYSSQILAILGRPQAAWQNGRNYYDVNASGTVDPQDLLLVFNELAKKGAHTLTGAPDGQPLWDVNGDGSISPIDANRLATALLTNTGNLPTTSAAGISLVPEPSSVLLALSGLLLAPLAWRRAKARRNRQ